ILGRRTRVLTTRSEQRDGEQGREPHRSSPPGTGRSRPLNDETTSTDPSLRTRPEQRDGEQGREPHRSAPPGTGPSRHLNAETTWIDPSLACPRGRSPRRSAVT